MQSNMSDLEHICEILHFDNTDTQGTTFISFDQNRKKKGCKSGRHLSITHLEILLSALTFISFPVVINSIRGPGRAVRHWLVRCYEEERL